MKIFNFIKGVLGVCGVLLLNSSVASSQVSVVQGKYSKYYHVKFTVQK